MSQTDLITAFQEDVARTFLPITTAPSTVTTPVAGH